jgi:hypothetical protein
MYRHTHRSLLRLTQDTLTSLTGLDRTALVVNFDAHASIQELPAGDLVGPSGFTLTDMGQGHFELAFAIAVSTQQDKDNFRLTDLMDGFARRLAPERKFTIFNSTTGAAISEAIIEEGTQLSPVNRAETRATASVTVTAQIRPLTG